MTTKKQPTTSKQGPTPKVAGPRDRLKDYLDNFKKNRRQKPK